MNAKKTLSLSLASAMALGLLAGCGQQRFFRRCFHC